MCEFCQEERDLLSKEIPHVMWDKYAYDVTLNLFIDRGYLRLVDKEDCGCLDHGEKIKIKFCPMCGKKLS